VILERWRGDGELPGAIFREIVNGIAGDGRVEGGGLFEVGDEFAEGARVHDCAGKLVGTYFAGFFQHVNIFGGERGGFVRLGVLLDQICEVEGTCQAGGASADDQDVCFELFALGGHGRQAIPWLFAPEIGGKKRPKIGFIFADFRKSLCANLDPVRRGLIVCFLRLLFLTQNRLEMDDLFAKSPSFFCVGRAMFRESEAEKSLRERGPESRRLRVTKLRSEESSGRGEDRRRLGFAAFC
jgi:hypothetical protein